MLPGRQCYTSNIILHWMSSNKVPGIMQIKGREGSLSQTPSNHFREEQNYENITQLTSCSSPL